MIQQNFDKIYNIMEQSFPSSEIRTYENQKKLLDNKCYKIIFQQNKNHNEIILFICFWDLDDCLFIEHFATNIKYRNKGIGNKFLKQFITTSKKPIILEVEKPIKHIQKRRISFYEKLGFKLSNYKYTQPSLKENSKTCKLHIMSYPNNISKEDFLKYKKQIFNIVYKTDKII